MPRLHQIFRPCFRVDAYLRRRGAFTQGAHKTREIVDIRRHIDGGLACRAGQFDGFHEGAVARLPDVVPGQVARQQGRAVALHACRADADAGAPQQPAGQCAAARERANQQNGYPITRRGVLRGQQQDNRGHAHAAEHQTQPAPAPPAQTDLARICQAAIRRFAQAPAQPEKTPQQPYKNRTCEHRQRGGGLSLHFHHADLSPFSRKLIEPNCAASACARSRPM